MSHEYLKFYQFAWWSAASWRIDSQSVTTSLEHLSRLIELCIERDPALAAVMVFGMVNGTPMLYHSVSDLGQTERAQLELEIIEAATTYLSK